MQQPSERRERKKQAVRQSLEEAAVRLFDERGFAETTIDQIADEADVSRSTFFRYFGSKEAVIFSAYDETGDILARLILERPAEESLLLAFENAVIELPAALPVPPNAELAERRGRVVDSNPVLKSKSEELTHRWRFAIAETLAARDGKSAPDRGHLLAASVGIAVLDRISDAFTAGGADRSLESLIRDEFQLLRDLVR